MNLHVIEFCIQQVDVSAIRFGEALTDGANHDPVAHCRRENNDAFVDAFVSARSH